ncbi:MAG: GTPase Era [Bacteroidetes bacterium]|nr:GTPase Era [Bacteroidota bacterium]
MHKAGFVNIIGCPNVGKSTLLNALIGQKLSIISSKAQTTRHRVMGIVNEPEYQIIFSDTPGILKPNYKLHEKMMRFVSEAIEDADIFLLITDMFEDIALEESYIKKLNEAEQPVLLLINKIDLTDETKLHAKVAQWKEKIPRAEIIPISALHNANIDVVMKRILHLLPLHAPFYDKDQITDKPERFFVSEIIREKILLNYQKEIPYSVEVVVESFKEEEKIIRIEATIFVERDSQKGILIGHKGETIKKMGIQARTDCEAFFDKHIHLQLYVKVDKNWRNDDKRLKRYGYHY